jgi:Antibiotic biosynthesis monooxygenase
MVRVVWEFVARADKVSEFESTYANSGPWANLFRKNGGYHGTMLLRDAENARRYWTIDRWQNATARCASGAHKNTKSWTARATH